MGTRSDIIVQHPKTKDFASIYCHWDGYISHHGPILLTHYDTIEKVVALVSLGSLSELHPTPEECVTHHKMHGEDINIHVGPHLVDHMQNEYSYLYADGVWYVDQWSKGWQVLQLRLDRPNNLNEFDETVPTLAIPLTWVKAGPTKVSSKLAWTI